MLITTEGIVIRMSVADISEQGRNTSGMKLMDIDANSDVMVAGIVKVREKQQKDENPDEVELNMNQSENVEDRSKLEELLDAAMKDAEDEE